MREGASGPVFVTILTDGACTTVGKLPKSEGNGDQIRREIQTQIQIQIQIHICPSQRGSDKTRGGYGSREGDDRVLQIEGG